jgi:hypothetical protein
MIRHQNTTVATTATALWTDAADTSRGRRRLITIQNRAGQAIFIGDSTVTTSVYGFTLAVSTSVTFEVAKGDVLYGIVAATTQVVGVMVVDAG